MFVCFVQLDALVIFDKREQKDPGQEVQSVVLYIKYLYIRSVV